MKSCETRGALPQEGGFLKLFEWTDEDCGQLKDISSIGNIVDETSGKSNFLDGQSVCSVHHCRGDVLKSTDSRNSSTTGVRAHGGVAHGGDGELHGGAATGTKS
ncbi:hypothetical protein GQ600_17845 [Phytophthora cactorum]|nr:hypothetical protein GQ600_17845 [Phytophthora cactorum]